MSGTDGGNGDTRGSSDVTADAVSDSTRAADTPDPADTPPDIPVDSTADSGADVAPEIDQDLPAPDLCVPSCPGDCGDDGCGGSCGECADGEECIDGQCTGPQPCQSSKDCDGDLVCDTESGECVLCVDAPDCPDGFKCNAEHECAEVYLCDSDKDCTAVDMVCDKDAGECVDCLGNADCLPEEHCVETTCVDDVCDQGLGDPLCAENKVVVCADDGSAWLPVEQCGAEEYCESAECLPWMCEPGETGCADEIASTCNDNGSGYSEEQDCEASGKVCVDAECQEVVCDLDDYPQCADPTAVLHCIAKGTTLAEVACGGGQFCSDGAGNCEAWVCQPGGSTCDEQVAKTCDQWGSGWSEEIDCDLAGLYCYQGGCEDQVCTPGYVWCLTEDSQAHCDEAGMAFDTVPCGAEQTCWDDQCHDWVCPPGQPMCAGKIATLCDLLGSGPKPGGESCDGLGVVCLDGECVCILDSCPGLGVECGGWPDGCGGQLDCGQCPGAQDDCVDGLCICTPACELKECGGDGCGGSCGGCPGANNQCQGGTCVCVPSVCDSTMCGEMGDGCGGQIDCAGCPDGHECQGNQCVCIPDCEGKECGDNGCGGNCGWCGWWGGNCWQGTCYDQPGCVTSNSKGCGGCACEACVCGMDGFCCNNHWDAQCVTECLEDCGGCI